jgi:hypothetical protein
MKPELRPFAGVNLPTGTQRQLFTDAGMVGAQLALEIKPSFHLVGSFGWVASQNSYPVGDDNTDIFLYDVGVEFDLIQSLGGSWEFKPFIGAGAGARTYSFAGPLRTRTCASGYATIGTEFQYAPWALRLEARDNLFCYKSPIAGVKSQTRNDIGLSFGLAYHFR